jgi:hypothetical protein
MNSLDAGEIDAEELKELLACFGLTLRTSVTVNCTHSAVNYLGTYVKFVYCNATS